VLKYIHRNKQTPAKETDMSSAAKMLTREGRGVEEKRRLAAYIIAGLNTVI